MLIAILLTAAIVIAVFIYSICKVSGRAARLEEDENIKWAIKWNKQRELEKEWCGNTECKGCNYLDNCPFAEVQA